MYFIFDLVVISLLNDFEKDYTTTHKQASLAIKSIIAQMINSILTPVITAYYIKTDSGIYQIGGLVDNIFMMGIFHSFLPPIKLLINPYNMWVNLKKCIKSRISNCFVNKDAKL